MSDQVSAEQKTREHIALVQSYLAVFAMAVLERARVHDRSKLEDPEKAAFDEFTHKLSDCEYGSEEYKQGLKDLGEALTHHYDNNSHHPEHHEGGVDGMSLVDVVEMFCDWMASCKRNKSGDIVKSIIDSEDRFSISHQLSAIMINTVPEIGSDDAMLKAIDFVHGTGKSGEDDGK